MSPATATAAAAAAALALLLLLLPPAAAAGEAGAAKAGAADAPGDLSGALEYEVENAPFAVVVEHSGGHRCGGALISLHAALTSVSCALGTAPAPPADLWARAPGTPWADGTRRVARIAVATDNNIQDATYGDHRVEEAWLGAVLDLALIELESPFGAAARARSIIMATKREECVPRSWTSPSPCVAVRTPLSDSAQLRAAAAAPAPPGACAARAPHWPAIADHALCFTGPQLCSSDRGVGVVCAGKLCGVVSRSARAGGGGGSGEAGGGGGAGAEGCGITHAVLLLPTWNEFLHCARTPHSCGRDSCATVCSERWLLDEPGVGGGGGGGGGGGSSDDGGGKDHPDRGEVSGGGGGGTGGGRGDGGGGEGSDEDVALNSTNSREVVDRAIFSNRYISLPPLYNANEEQERERSPAQEQTPEPTPEQAPEPAPEPAPWPVTSTEPAVDALENVTSGLVVGLPTRSRSPPISAPPLHLTSPPPLHGPLPPPSLTKDAPQPARYAKFNFEPNRADFKVGEYGDNVANYDSDDEPPTRSTSTTTTPRTRVRVLEALREAPPADPALAPTPAPTPRAKPAQEPAAQRRSSSAASSALPLPMLIPSFCIFNIRIFR